MFQKANNFPKIIDGDINTSWQTRWSKTQTPIMELPPFDRTYGVYIDINNLDINSAVKVKMASGTGHNKPTEWSIYKKEDNGVYIKLGTYKDTFPSAASEFTTDVFLTGKCSSIRIAITKTSNATYGTNSLTNPVWNGNNSDSCPNVSIGEITVYGK